MHAIIIFLYYLSKLLNLTLNLESLSSSFLNKLILLVNGWCMLGMFGACWVCFLLPTFTRLGHECQDIWSLCDG